jgi:hypothetical protein
MVICAGASSSSSKKKKRKSRRKRRNRNRNSTLSIANHKRLCNAVCCQIDPFCNNCTEGIYDNNSSKVLRMNLRSFANVSTNAAGDAAVMFVPAWFESLHYQPTIDAAPQVTSWGTPVSLPYYSAANFSHFRIISMGMRFVSSVAPTNAQGFVTGMVSDSEETINLEQFHLYKDAAQVRLYQGALTWIARPKGPESHAFTTVGSVASAWEYGYIAVTSGPASTAIGRVEFVMNIEALPVVKGGAVPAILAQEAKPSVPQVLSLANNAQAQMPPFHDETKDGKDTSKSVMEVVEDVVTTGLATYGPQILEGIVGALL